MLDKRAAPVGEAVIPGQLTLPPAAPGLVKICRPCLMKAARIKAIVVDLKEQLKKLRKEKAAKKEQAISPNIVI